MSRLLPADNDSSAVGRGLKDGRAEAIEAGTVIEPDSAASEISTDSSATRLSIVIVGQALGANVPGARPPRGQREAHACRPCSMAKAGSGDSDPSICGRVGVVD